MRRRQPPVPPPVPFSPAAARAHRAGLGLTPEQVAGGMAAHGVRLLPTHVLAWESGELVPTEQEFIALARALWCPADQLMGVRPASLRDFRIARELAPESAAARIGVTVRRYLAAETLGRWDGDEAETDALARVLGLTLRELVGVTGRREELERCLRACVDGRWQAQLAAVGRIVPVDGRTLTAVLSALQNESRVTAHWGGGWGRAAPDHARPADPAGERRPPVERFWELLARHETDLPV